MCFKSRFGLGLPFQESLGAVGRLIIIDTFASSFVVVVAKLRDTERFFFICVLSALSLTILLISVWSVSKHLSFQVSSFSGTIDQRHNCNRKVF
jgi:hypothetical protein